MAIVHLSPNETVWVIVLFFITNYGFMIILILSIMNNVQINKADKLENKILIGYLLCKCIYHIANSNLLWNDFLNSLHSETWSGRLTFVILGILIFYQILNNKKI